MKFIFILALSALFLGIFGCASQARDFPVPPMGEGNDYFPEFDGGAYGQEPAGQGGETPATKGPASNGASGQAGTGSQENPETGNQAGQGTPDGGVQYDIPSVQENTGASDSPSGQDSDSQPSKTKYVAYASMFQYDKQSRDKMKDIIQKAYAIEVDVSDVSGGIGTGKPLQNPQNAVIRLTGPSTDITLKQGPISKQEYDSLPVSAAWPPFPGYTDSSKSQFFYAKNNALLPGGNYKLTIDADGDGQVDGESDFTVPGVQVSNPTFHSKQPESGFSLQWSQSGRPEETFYTISTGQGFAGLDSYLAQSENLKSTSIAITPASLDEDGTIENGNYLLNFQADSISAVSYSDEQDYAMGKSQKKLIFVAVLVKEAHFILYNVGDFCHCDDSFMEGPCTVDEIYADPLCN